MVKAGTGTIIQHTVVWLEKVVLCEKEGILLMQLHITNDIHVTGDMISTCPALCLCHVTNALFVKVCETNMTGAVTYECHLAGARHLKVSGSMEQFASYPQDSYIITSV